MSVQPIQLAINGATGRMGRRIAALIQDDPEIELTAAIGKPGDPRLGQDFGAIAGLGTLGVPLTDRLETTVEVVIDVSAPEGTMAIAEVCRSKKLSLVVGTTGHSDEQRAELERLAHEIPLLIASNFSRAVNVLMRLVRQAAEVLGPEADIEIIERHHRFKQDAPSGTALRLAEIAAEAAGTPRFVHGRHGRTGERPHDEIGLHALRTADNPGEHTVVFGLMGETLELSHRALNRDGFCRGAIAAAKDLANRPPGRYTMDDLLG